MADKIQLNEINFDHHPAPWRMEDAPKGWGDSTVVFDANNECVYRVLYPIKSKRETWENIIRLVNQKQSPERFGVNAVVMVPYLRQRTDNQYWIARKTEDGYEEFWNESEKEWKKEEGTCFNLGKAP